MKDHLKHIGRNIRAARNKRKLTLDALSELIGISPSFLGTVERGESSLSIETLMSACRELDVSADSIIFEKELSATLPLSEKKNMLLELMNNSSNEELTFLIDYTKFYRERVNFHDATPHK